LDYLLKPIEFGRFLQACNRAYAQATPARDGAPGIFVKDGYDWVRVNIDQVLYIHSDTNLLFIQEQNRQVTTRMTIAEMLATLPPDEFIRIHKSYIVALKAIHKIERHQVTVGNATIPLAGSYRDALQNRLLGKEMR
jgi:DNA-binding LytR/AlgR family response regulator